jgi:hypothetical protein
VHQLAEQVIQPRAQAADAVDQLLRQGAVARGQTRAGPLQRAVRQVAGADALQRLERGPARGTGPGAQSSIPVRGEDGTARSRRGIRPAR